MRTCSSCGYSENRDEARFCIKCAAPLAPPTNIACLRCGTLNPPEARYCLNCASPLVRVPAIGMTGLLTPNTLLQARYMIADKIGEGGMGAVYLAHDTRLQGKQWALKEMSDAQLTDPAERQNAVVAFRREAQLLATLDHANLPKVVDFFQEGGKHYLVMDFIQGQSLERAVLSAPGFLPEATVLGWIEQVCDVLAYLHTCQPPIIFRDLKPGNIMVTSEGKIKLIDFGIARFFKAGKAKDTAAYGTMGYAAPEQFGTGQTDARSDIYALGVTLHFLLTKYDPSLTPFNLPPARNINPQLSAQAEAVIARATRSVVAERFESAVAMKQALRSVARAPVAVSPVSAPGPTRPLVTPYMFAPGKTASTLQELVELCEQDWDRAVAQFYDGNFELWLKSIGEFGLASEAKRITSGRTHDLVEKGLALMAWIAQTGVQRSTPVLAVGPTSIAIDPRNVAQSQEKHVSVGKIAIGNPGGGFLVADVESSAPWLAPIPTRASCATGQSGVVELFADPSQMNYANPRPEKITVRSIARVVDIPVIVSACPILDVDLDILDFGSLTWLRQDTISFMFLPVLRRAFTIKNRGSGMLKNRITVTKGKPWLKLSVKEGEEIGTGRIEAFIDPRALVNCSEGNQAGAIEISGNGGTRVVRVIVER